MGAHSRTKGHAFEREVAEELRPLYPSARRGLSQARSGKEVPDVEGTPWWVECKRGDASLTAALKQARDSTDGRIPLVFMRRDRQKSMVVVDIEDFKRILADVEELRILRAGGEAHKQVSVPAHEQLSFERLEG